MNPTPEPPKSGARLKAAREAAGLSRHELAALLRVGYQRVANMENDHKETSLETLYRAAVAIGCRPSDLDPRLTRDRPRKKTEK